MKQFACALCCVIACSVFCLADDAAPKEPFNGKNLDGWKAVDPNADNFWTAAGKAVISKTNPQVLELVPLGLEEKSTDLVNLSPDWRVKGTKRGVDFYSGMKFGDCVIDLEFMVSKDSNSGIYVMGEYEVQVLDSWGHEKMGPGDVGALYGAAPPKVNASTEPGTWQRFVIDFSAPKFDADGKKTANAKFNKITLNGQVVQENVEMKDVTPGGITGKEAATGPLMFQGNHGPVAYRNIKVYEK